jgi:hypothetical protein
LNDPARLRFDFNLGDGFYLARGDNGPGQIRALGGGDLFQGNLDRFGGICFQREKYGRSEDGENKEDNPQQPAFPLVSHE